MLVSLDLGDVAVVVAELQAARREHLERADASDDPGTAARFRAAADRFERIADTLAGTVHRWHEFDRGRDTASRLSLVNVDL